MIRKMKSLLINFENKFEATVPVNWSKKGGLDNHLTLSRSAEEMMIIRRDEIRLFGQMSLFEYMGLLRDTASKLKHAGNMEMSSVEPFNTPLYEGAIMTYAFDLYGRASEITLFAFKTEAHFYALMLQTPADCPHETLSEFFDIVNSFRVADEKTCSPKNDFEGMKFKIIRDMFREVSITVPDNWVNIIDSYNTETDYLIFVSSGDRNQAVGISKTVYPEQINHSDCVIVEINGLKGLQYEEESMPQLVQLKFLNTVIVTEGDFFMISCWTPPAVYEEYAGLFDRITNSFKINKRKVQISASVAHN